MFYRFDTNSSQWIVFKYELPTDEEFAEYGVSDITSDVGLPNDYKIIIKSDDVVNSVGVSVVPCEQTIQITIDDDMLIRSHFTDIDPFDALTFDVDTDVTRKFYMNNNPYIEAKLKINKKRESNDKIKVYVMDVNAY